MKEGLPTHHFVLCLLSYPSYPRWQAGYAVRANWEVSVGHGSISKIEMYACRLCVPPAPPQWRSIAAAAVRGVNLGRSTHFCVHARCFLRNDMKTRWFTVDKDNLEPCLLIQNAKYSILKPSLSAPPSTLFMICCLEPALTFMSLMSSILWFLLDVHWPTLFLTHRIWQIRPLCPRSKWNMDEILAFLA